jgi:hypothetical protein
MLFENSKIRPLFDVKTPMRDGICLSSDIYLPQFTDEDSYPTILIRTPYDNTQKSHVDMAHFFALNGYAFVIQDVRGRCDSDGEWYPFFNEGLDGFDMINWIADQPWCNGKVGMMGGSYRGWVQWAAAREKPKNLVTMISSAAGGYWMKEFPFLNGVPTLWILAWLNTVGGKTPQRENISVIDWEKVFYHLPLRTKDETMGRTNTVWKEWMSHPDLDYFWEKVLFDKEDFERIDLPVLHITGWYDGDQPGALFFYEGMVNHSPSKGEQYVIIGPWDHAGTRNPKKELAGVDFSLNSLMDMKRVHLTWFDHFLKGKKNEFKDWKKTKYFTMGKNEWVEENRFWIDQNSRYVEYYLHSKGRANTLLGDGKLTLNKMESSSDSFNYNPEDPVIVVMDFNLRGSHVETPLDKRFILNRSDVLVYTSEEVSNLVISGRPILKFFASSNCRDTDWYVLLTDVYPDGKSIIISSGILRARYRNSLHKQELLTPGNLYEYTIVMDSTSISFEKNHRLRLAITSSAFPRYARNLNTGNEILDDKEIHIAINTVYNGIDNPSVLSLPIK